MTDPRDAHMLLDKPRRTTTTTRLGRPTTTTRWGSGGHALRWVLERDDESGDTTLLLIKGDGWYGRLVTYYEAHTTTPDWATARSTAQLVIATFAMADSDDCEAGAR